MDQKTYGVWAVRYCSSIFGHAQAWCKEDGKIIEFDSEDAAKAYASELNEKTTANVRYYVKEKEPEPGAVRKTENQADLTARAHDDFTPRDAAAEKLNEIPGRQLAPDGKAPMPGRPAHLPENYLLNAELHKEAQTGNYNMLDGRLDNLAPEKPDLTDGQTHDELMELAPETLADEKESVLDRLKAELPEHETRRFLPGSPERER